MFPRARGNQPGKLVSDAPMRRLAIVVLTACSGKPIAQPAPVTPAVSVSVDPIASWMARIPAACRVEPPIPELACPAPSPVPSDACVVEQRDLETGTVVDRMVFQHRRLIQANTTTSSNQQTSSSFEYDGLDRLTRKTACTTSNGGGVRYDSPITTIDREERLYAKTSRVPMFGRAVRTTRYDGKVESTDTRFCYAFDARGRRVERYQVYRMSHRPEAFDSTIHSYDYGDGEATPSVNTKAGARSMTASTLNLDRRTDNSFNVRFKMAWTARFTYDHRGLLVSSGTDDSQTKLRYDDRGRLNNYSGITIAWSGDRIASITGLGQGYDREYHYDVKGRLVDVSYGRGIGYRVTYSATCATDLVHPVIAPNIDNYLYYEGKDTL